MPAIRTRDSVAEVSAGEKGTRLLRLRITPSHLALVITASDTIKKPKPIAHDPQDQATGDMENRAKIEMNAHLNVNVDIISVSIPQSPSRTTMMSTCSAPTMLDLDAAQTLLRMHKYDVRNAGEKTSVEDEVYEGAAILQSFQTNWARKVFAAPVSAAAGRRRKLHHS